MALALSPELPESLLSNLIVVDIAPSKGSLSSEFRQYVSVMRMIEQSGVSTRKEANEMLEAVEQVNVYLRSVRRPAVLSYTGRVHSSLSFN